MSAARQTEKNRSGRSASRQLAQRAHTRGHEVGFETDPTLPVDALGRFLSDFSRLLYGYAGLLGEQRECRLVIAVIEDAVAVRVANIVKLQPVKLVIPENILSDTT